MNADASSVLVWASIVDSSDSPIDHHGGADDRERLVAAGAR